MDVFGRHSLTSFGREYGQKARHNKVALATSEADLVERVIFSRLAENGPFPDADDHLGDIYATYDAGFTDVLFKTAAFAFTVHVATPYNAM